MKENLIGVDMIHLIGTALKGAKELVNEGNLSLGETTEIEMDLPKDPLIENVFGTSDSIRVLYIDQSYKLITQTLVDKPSVIILIDQMRLANLWEQLDEDYEKLTGEDAEDGTAPSMISDILSEKYGANGSIHLESHAMISTFTMPI